jgi:enolase
MQKISSINAIQVFDSRGVPTISCKVVLDDGISASAMVPSGASTGSKEALELRDNDVSYNGKSVSKAVSNINDILSSLVIGKDPNNQKEIDESLILFDNTKDKSKFGANAILAISLAVAHVAAKANKISLYEHFSKVYKDITGDDVTHCMPLPMFNILNGGEHADNNIDIQEFMIIPSGAKNFVEVMQWATEIYHNLKKILLLNNHSTAVGDEGGFAPSLESNKEALKLIVDAIEETGLVPGKDVNIALDCAATEFYDGDNYILSGEQY